MINKLRKAALILPFFLISCTPEAGAESSTSSALSQASDTEEASSESQSSEEAVNHGTFYSMEELYENKTLTHEDIKNIAYYNNDGIYYDENYDEVDEDWGEITPLAEVSEATFEVIKEDFFAIESQDPYYEEDPLTFDQIDISVYCGVYHDYVAVRFFNTKALAAVVGYSTLDGIIFCWPYDGGNHVILWLEGE